MKRCSEGYGGGKEKETSNWCTVRKVEVNQRNRGLVYLTPLSQKDETQDSECGEGEGILKRAHEWYFVL